jgi:hypothetical protein
MARTAGPPCRRPGNLAGGFTGSTCPPERDCGFSTNLRAKPLGSWSAAWGPADRRLDFTDLFMFTSDGDPDKTVLIIDSNPTSAPPRE